MVTESENVLLFLGEGVLAWLLKFPPRPRTATSALFLAGPLPGAAGAVEMAGMDGNLLVQMALFFGKAVALVFGSDLAIAPSLYAGCVHEMKWLTDGQFSIQSQSP